MRPSSGYFFDDYVLGQVFDHATPRTVTQGDAALYIGLTGARHAPHCASTVAQALGHPQSPMDDLLVFHIAFGKTVPDISYNAVANLGYAEVQFLLPVYAGDTLTASTEIIGLKPNSNGKTGVVYVRSQAKNQHGNTVLSWVRWVMINRLEGAVNSASPSSVPSLKNAVDARNLAIPAFLKPAGLTCLHTGSSKFFNDYAVGDVINHPAGMTINDTDHTLATKLYQNTARVHFDALHMQSSRFGQRLVYGGQIISIARALSFDGLENVISIAAINSGSHTNPCFADDTIYAKTIVQEKHILRDDLGALTLRLIGIKNALPATVDHTGVEPNANIVLDLNYTVLMHCKNA
jgi:2-methylfumaryl-CoA hydratase